MITIIVLLILAGVTVATLTGDNGLLTKTGQAKQANENATLEEKIKLAYLEYELESRINPNVNIEIITKNSLEKAFNESITSEKIGNSLKITFNDRNKSYKYLANGNIIEFSAPTEMYGKLDEDGTLYLRSTKINDDYKRMYNNAIYSNYTVTDIIKIVIEDTISPTGGYRMFYNLSNLKKIENIEKLHTENLTSMVNMFYNCTSLENLDLSKFDTSSVTHMSGLFVSCNSLEEIDISSFNTSQTYDISNMFTSCGNLKKLNLSSFNTENVNTISGIFAYCSKLQEINLGRNFVFKDNVTVNGHEFDYISSNIKIITTRAIANRLKQIRNTLQESNFQIIQ